MGLPPFTYGAGINLFTTRSSASSCTTSERTGSTARRPASSTRTRSRSTRPSPSSSATTNLFFPGGTRSRSGAIEQHLKLGLLGAGLHAYINNLRNGRRQPNIYVIPCTINYHLVLEAETLIDDYLKEAGKSQYIIEHDEFSRPERLLSFLRNIFQLDARIYIHFGAPLDPFGNPVDEEGRSLDGHGRPIDLRRYTLVHGEPAHEPQRDAEYTRLLGAQVAAEFLRRNTVLPTQAVAYAAFEALRRRHQGLDLYRLLRVRGPDRVLREAELLDAVGRLQAALSSRAAAGVLRIGAPLRTGDAAEILGDALRHFGIYHTRPVLARRGDRLYPADLNLLFYYHNRLTQYGLEQDGA